MSDYGGYLRAHVIFARVSLPVIFIEFKAQPRGASGIVCRKIDGKVSTVYVARI